MSILRQLLLSITIAIGVILLGTVALSVSAARDYLSGQLQAQSSDTAVSLALSLSQPGNDDRIIQELLISALFDGGRFSLVQLADPQGDVVFVRQAESAAPSVPRWFRSLLPLSAKSATHTVTDGWRQIGTVTITADDSYAWETLWRSSLQMISLVIGAGILWALFAFALVRWIKQRLFLEVSEQLRAMGQGQLDSGPTQSRVPELSGVTHALNQTREQLRMTAEEHNTRIEQMEVELNRDPITGLANRKYFLNEFRRTLEAAAADAPQARSGKAAGHILAFRLRDLAAINRNMPRAFVDQWLLMLCSRLNQVLISRNLPGSVLGRLNGSDFALLLPHCETPTAMMLAERLRAELRTSRIPVGEGELCRWVQALTDYAPGAEAGDVLARLDNALMRAESAGNDHVSFTPDGGSAGSYRGEHAWQQTIQSALDGQRFTLANEALRDQNDQIVGHEATLMLQTGDQPDAISAAVFIPAAVRLNLAADCDLEALRLGLDWLRGNPGDLTIRLCLPSLRLPSFLKGLERLLVENPQITNRLILEIDAHGLIERPGDVKAFCHMAIAHDARVGLRRLAQQFSALTELHGLPVSYVKLSGGFVTGMAQSPGSQALANSVLEIAKACRIEVYAEDVPDDSTRQLLRAMGVTRMRGP